MPVRSLSSFVLKWPDRAEVDRAVRRWAGEQVNHHPRLRRLGYFGSYARGDWGVGSDLDLIALVESSDEPFHARGRHWALESLPVPAQIVVYTLEEWQRMRAAGGRFAKTIEKETVWVYPAG